MQTIDITLLIRSALQARSNAYVPYSHMAVGAALLTADGTVYTGCNLENAAYSPTLCAERVALAKALSDGVRNFSAIAVTGGPQELADDLPTLFYPCGVCRQMLSEHCSGDMPVIIAKSCDDYVIRTLGQLLPDSFSL